jgi:hypothetical protein
MFTTLITCTELQALQQSAAPLLIVDCTADLMNPAAGLRQFLDAHIPGATHAPDGHPKLLHCWPVKLLQAGRGDYAGSEVMIRRAAASLSL